MNRQHKTITRCLKSSGAILIVLFISAWIFTGPSLFSQETKSETVPKDKTKDKVKTIGDYFNESTAALGKEDYTAYTALIKKAVALHPGFLPLKYHLARGYVQLKDKKEALKLLADSAEMGLTYRFGQDKYFDPLKDSEEYKGLAEQFERNRKPVGGGEVAFVIPEKDLIPEGITYNPKTGTFYVTAIYKRKIVSISRSGKVSDFISEKQGGFWGGVGLDVDNKRQVMWVLCGTGNQMKDYKEEKEGKSAVFKYDLTTGKQVKKYLLADNKKHLLNDLTLRSDGDVFMTDSDFSAVYTIPHTRDKLELFVAPGQVPHPNGMDISGDEKYLYVAHLEGISRIHTDRRIAQPLKHPENVLLTGIDGLYVHQGNLIAVQNYGGLNRVVRFHLNKAGDTVERLEILDANNPLFNIPTTGVPVGNTFYYIANSQLASFNADHTLFPMEKLKEVVILKTGLGD